MWQCRPSDTNPSWAQQRHVACGWHLISCFPGVYLPACSLLLQITVERSGVRNSTQKMETVWLEKLRPNARCSHEVKLKRGFLSCPEKKESLAAVTGSYITVILSCAEWEPEKRLDRTGALLLNRNMTEWNWNFTACQTVKFTVAETGSSQEEVIEEHALRRNKNGEFKADCWFSVKEARIVQPVILFADAQDVKAADEVCYPAWNALTLFPDLFQYRGRTLNRNCLCI